MALTKLVFCLDNITNTSINKQATLKNTFLQRLYARYL